MGVGRWSSVAGAGFGLALIALAGAACGGDGAPKAKLIVYEARDDAGATNIWTIDPGNGKSRQLTHGKGFDGNPAWSPDRKRIIFSSDRDGRPNIDDLYTMNADGGNVTRLTDTPDDTDWSAKFSPDGVRIAWVAGKGADFYLMIANADGTSAEQVAGPYSFAEFPSWRRDGSQVWFSAIEPGRSDADIYSYDPASREQQTRISTPAADVCPHFSHDGTTVTYATAAADDPNNVDLYAHDLASDDASGADDIRLTDAEGLDDYGNPSPDDASMVFLSEREDPGETYNADRTAEVRGNTELYLMDRDGKNQRRLTDTPTYRENVPDW